PGARTPAGRCPASDPRPRRRCRSGAAPCDRDRQGATRRRPRIAERGPWTLLAVGTFHIERYAGGPICSRSLFALIGQWTGGDPWGIVRAMAKSPFSLEGKTAIDTGGGTGIGKSLPIEFGRAGDDVALWSRKHEAIERVVKAVRDIGKRSFAVAVDVRQEDQVKATVDRAVEEWGRLDIMVNNAGASF